MVRLLSWNISGKALWEQAAREDVDVALLQEARRPPAALESRIIPSAEGAWATEGWEPRPWRTAVARVSDQVHLTAVRTAGVGDLTSGDMLISRPGSLAVAGVSVNGAPVFTAVSMYAPWERPPNSQKPICSDASAHRLLSDLSALVWGRKGHRIVAAGDLNILLGYGDYGSPYWGGRYATVFERAHAMGLVFAGPQAPNGRQATPWPSELPSKSMNVPTYHSQAQRPSGATRQLDFVFVSEDLRNDVRVRALNDPADWGPSDHCRLIIDVDLRH